MKIGNWRLHFFNPFKKSWEMERIAGVRLVKDWHNEYGFDVRFSIFEYPHTTISLYYTTKTEFITRFWNFRSKSYNNYVGGLSFYEYRKYINGIDDARESCG